MALISEIRKRSWIVLVTVALGSIDYRKSRKRVHCFAGPLPTGAEAGCTSWEIDRAEFLPLTEARAVLHPDQRPFLDRLEQLLSEQPPG